MMDGEDDDGEPDDSKGARHVGLRGVEDPTDDQEKKEQRNNQPGALGEGPGAVSVADGSEEEEEGGDPIAWSLPPRLSANWRKTVAPSAAMSQLMCNRALGTES